MKITIDQNILNEQSAFKIGLNHYTKITVSESPQMLKGRLQLFQEQLFFELEDQNIADRPSIQEWRNVWKTFGGNPSRYRSSIESLMRRIKKQNYLLPFNSAVDMNNFFSLQYEIPTGVYDTKFIDGDVTFHIGTNATSYEGLNGRLNHLENLIVLSDAKGAFGSPYVDSKRTAVNEQTTDIIQVFFLRPSMKKEEALTLLKAAGNMFTTIHGGETSTALLHKEETSFIPNE